MTKDKTYNGHKNKTQWNVSIWINNDEGLYRWAVDLRKRYSAYRAAVIMKKELPSKTPDGYTYSVDAIKNAIADIRE